VLLGTAIHEEGDIVVAVDSAPPTPRPLTPVVVAAANSESVGFCHRPLLATYLILTQF
jgi:hypothetical protein